MIQIEYLPLVLTGLSITASIIYYASILRNANKNQKIQQETRNAQIFMQFIDKLHNPELLSNWIKLMRWEWKDLEDFERKYGSVDHPDLFGIRYSFWATLNDLGWLVEKEIVGVEDVNTIVGPVLIWTWDKFEDIILEHRRVYNFPDQYLYWERLNHKVMEYRKQANIQSDVPEYMDDYLSTIKENP